MTLDAGQRAVRCKYRKRGVQSANPDGILKAVATAHFYRAVLDCPPSESAAVASKESFERFWEDFTNWGQVVFIVHTDDGVLKRLHHPRCLTRARLFQYSR
jgi:putative heme iron utilization protein